jgi:hypothetical protein
MPRPRSSADLTDPEGPMRAPHERRDLVTAMRDMLRRGSSAWRRLPLAA